MDGACRFSVVAVHVRLTLFAVIIGVGLIIGTFAVTRRHHDPKPFVCTHKLIAEHKCEIDIG